MAFTLPPLPYAANALEPHISQRTLEFHHGKHHEAYVKKLNELIEGKTYAKLSLEDIILQTAAKREDRAIFNNAAQVWNHSFFWHCMQPNGGGDPRGEIAKRMRESFGTNGGFRRLFTEAAVGQFGSGWAWLVLKNGKVDIVTTPDAFNPLVSGETPLLTCDVWEHAYYLDYQNRRQAFVEAFLDHLVNWDFVSKQLIEAETRAARETPAQAAGGRR
jgi:superoxide dismutase, Fe-Mn family